MGYLVAKIAALLILAAVVGAGTMYWWLSRRYQTKLQVSQDLITQLKRDLQVLSDESTRRIQAMVARHEAADDAMLARFEELIRLQESTQSETRELTHGARNIHQLVSASYDEITKTPRDGLLDKILTSIRAVISEVEGNTLWRDAVGIQFENLQRTLVTFQAASVSGAQANSGEGLGTLEAAVAGLRDDIQGLCELAADKVAVTETREEEIADSWEQSQFHILSKLHAIESQLATLGNTHAHRDDTAHDDGVAPPVAHNLLSAADRGAPDDLTRIRGVGPKLAEMLHEVGVYYFWQIADWSQDEALRVDNALEFFPGRIHRDRWVEQARVFARGTGLISTESDSVTEQAI